jgi:hypothetical protein
MSNPGIGGISRTQVPYLVPAEHWRKIRGVPELYFPKLIEDGLVVVTLTKDGPMIESNKLLSDDALRAIRRYKLANQPAQPVALDPTKWVTAAEIAARMGHPRKLHETIDPALVQEKIDNGSVPSEFCDVAKVRKMRPSDWSAYIRAIGGQRMLDREQLARDDRALEATHKKKVEKEKERAEQEREKEEQKDDGAGVLPWREELRELEEQRELDAIKRRVRENS